MVSKYLFFSAQVKKINVQHGLTRHEIKLLNLAAQRFFSSEAIAVGELIRQGNIASQPTLHAALKALVAKNLLTIQHSRKDGRVKQVMLTKKAFIYYKNLDRAIDLSGDFQTKCF
jgi:DNA-binding MarR family transcriptional regulator